MVPRFLYHFLVVLVGEVESGLQDFELVENFVVSRHVSGQDTSGGENIILLMFELNKRRRR